MLTVRDVFAPERSIDRKIEKVIDYAAKEEDRLDREIAEYEVTASVERGLRRFLEAFDAGTRGGDVAEVGVWVSGFYGSGKSSFTKYLGFALDARRTLHGRPFVERLAERVLDPTLQALLRTVAKRAKTAVFMMDLGTDAVAHDATGTVSSELYWKVLRDLGYSRETKVADLEIRLEREGRLDDFRKAHDARYPNRDTWDDIHDDGRLAVMRASELVPAFYPEEFPRPEVFQKLVYRLAESERDVAARLIELVRRRTGCDNVVFFIDEVGQYVAPRRELILNLDGLARNLKELGKGRVWLVATAQQTLTEISERAAFNSPELFKLKDRFPIAIELEATDIREITARRLLAKKPAAEADLARRFAEAGALLEMNTRLAGWPEGRQTLDADVFAKLYPFLPDRFDLVLSLIRALARRTGGTGLRSAISLVQDLLVDASRTLRKGVDPIAKRPIGRLVAADDLFDTLRGDLAREHPQAVEGVDRVAKHPDFRDDPVALRAAKAVAVLQPLENRPRTAENVAALLHPEVGAPGQAEAVRAALQRLVDARAFGLVELRDDAGAGDGGGFLFLSNDVQPLQKLRDDYVPTVKEVEAVRAKILGGLFDPIPQARVEGVRLVNARVVRGPTVVAGEGGEVTFSLEEAEPGGLEARVAALKSESQSREGRELAKHALWVYTRPVEVEELLAHVVRSEHIQEARGRKGPDRDAAASPDVSRYLRSEERRAERARDAVKQRYAHALFEGWLVFRGDTRAVRELGDTALLGATAFLDTVAARVFSQFALVKRNANPDVAQRFLEADRLANISKERDPLGLVQTRAGRTAVDKSNAALAEALRAFRELVKAAGAGRVQGAALLDHFHGPPYGWSKDTTRYLFAALLVAGEIELHTGDGVLRTAGPKAADAMRNTQNFARVGVAPRGEPVPIEALDRASQRLEAMFAVEVLPLEDQISRAVRAHFPGVMERVGSLPDRLRLLDLPGEERARRLLQTCASLLEEDAGGAASLLGAVDTAVPNDKKWADAVVKALDAHGEADLRAARDALARVGELAALFPAAHGLARSPAVATLADVLASGSFQDRIADLRGALRRLGDEAADVYRAELERHRADVASAREASALPWERLTDADRAEVAALFAALDAPEAPADALAELQRLFTRRLHAASLAASLDAVARRYREPAAAVTERPVESPDGEAVELPLADFAPAGALRSAAELDQWLAELRARLLPRIARHPVRLCPPR